MIWIAWIFMFRIFARSRSSILTNDYWLSLNSLNTGLSLYSKNFDYIGLSLRKLWLTAVEDCSISLRFVLYLSHLVENIFLDGASKFLSLLKIFLLSSINFSNNYSWDFSRLSSQNDRSITFTIDFLPRNRWDGVQTFFSSTYEAKDYFRIQPKVLDLWLSKIVRGLRRLTHKNNPVLKRLIVKVLFNKILYSIFFLR